MLSLDQTAPDFSLPDQDNHLHSLKSYLGQWVLLYFYPKDMTPGCTTEACSFRDHFDQLKHQMVVLGMSADSVASHKKFAQKHQLPFPILSDQTKDVIKAYQAWVPKKFMGKEFLGVQRISYLINPAGKIAKIYPKVDPQTHVSEVLVDLNALQ